MVIEVADDGQASEKSKNKSKDEGQNDGRDRGGTAVEGAPKSKEIGRNCQPGKFNQLKNLKCYYHVCT